MRNGMVRKVESRSEEGKQMRRVRSTRKEEGSGEWGG